MREIITTGKTVEEATQKALEELGLSLEEAVVEVIEMPQRKLFRSTPAKVRVSADESAPRRGKTRRAEGAGEERAEARAREKAAGEACAGPRGKARERGACKRGARAGADAGRTGG